jgi:hypothetical protein
LKGEAILSLTEISGREWTVVGLNPRQGPRLILSIEFAIARNMFFILMIVNNINSALISGEMFKMLFY